MKSHWVTGLFALSLAAATFASDSSAAREASCASDFEPACDAVCADDCCGLDCGEGVGDALPRFWVRGDYLAWQLTGADLPPLVTGSPLNTPIATAGELGQAATTVLAGNQEVGGDFRSGYQVSLGYWLDPCRGLALVGDYFAIGRDSYDYAAGPNAGQIITRPFFNTEDGVQDAQLVDAPGEVLGDVRIRAVDDFSGAGGGAQIELWNCCRGPCRSISVSAIGGYRYYHHDSTLQINENLTIDDDTTQPLIPGTTIALEDRFAARNEFHGGELGLQGRVQRQAFWLEGLALLAIGGNRRDVWVDGSTTNTVPDVGSASFDGGLLTSSVTNIGHYSDVTAVVIPRFRLGAGCQITEWLAINAGYSVVLWNGLAQASSHLPPGLAVDPRNLPPVAGGGGADPAFPGITGSNFVAHGFDAGVQLDF